jgi:HD superfamily phosphohydrolase YqeK
MSEKLTREQRLENALRDIEEACNYSPNREAGTWDVSLAGLIHKCARLLPAAGAKGPEHG